MKIYQYPLLLGLLLSLCSVQGHASRCEFSSFSRSSIELVAKRGERSDIQFNIHCDQNYTIKFQSANQTGGNGLSYLKFNRHKVPVLYTVSGSQNIAWNHNTFQYAANNKYLIHAQVIGDIPATLAAGQYTDLISVWVEY